MTNRSESFSTIKDDDQKCRLYMGNLPKVKTVKEIFDEISRITRGHLVRVITYKNFDDPSMHRGFCFLDYGSVAAATNAKQALSKQKVFGCKTKVDWADPEPQIDADTMAKVRILFVKQYGGVLDERVLAKMFGKLKSL
jgi:RNA recognition motif-containing protein